MSVLRILLLCFFSFLCFKLFCCFYINCSLISFYDCICHLRND